MSPVLRAVDDLLRAPGRVAEQARAGGDLRALFLASLAAIVLGAGVFGATLATSRGGAQVFYSGVKLPFALVATLLLVVPAFHTIASGLGRPLRFSGLIALTLAAAGRAGLVLIALSPLTWLAFDCGLSYHPGVLLATTCYCLAGISALRLVLRGIGFDARGYVIVGLFGLVLLGTGGQTAWMMRPFLGRPGAASVPFLRGKSGSFFDAIEQSTSDSLGLSPGARDEPR